MALGPASPGGIGSVFLVGAPCGSAGGAAFDPVSTDWQGLPHGAHCWLITAPPVVIDDTYMSIEEGFRQMDTDYHAQGYQPPVPDVSAVEGPIGAFA